MIMMSSSDNSDIMDARISRIAAEVYKIKTQKNLAHECNCDLASEVTRLRNTISVITGKLNIFEQQIASIDMKVRVNDSMSVSLLTKIVEEMRNFGRSHPGLVIPQFSESFVSDVRKLKERDGIFQKWMVDQAKRVEDMEKKDFVLNDSVTTLYHVVSQLQSRLPPPPSEAEKEKMRWMIDNLKIPEGIDEVKIPLSEKRKRGRPKGSKTKKKNTTLSGTDR